MTTASDSDSEVSITITDQKTIARPEHIRFQHIGNPGVSYPLAVIKSKFYTGGRGQAISLNIQEGHAVLDAPE